MASWLIYPMLLASALAVEAPGSTPADDRGAIVRELGSLADSLKVLCDSLGVLADAEVGYLLSGWSAHPQAIVVAGEGPDSASRAIPEWLEERGWARGNAGASGLCEEVSWWVRGAIGCEITETWGPCFAPGEMEPSAEDSVAAAQGRWYTYRIAVCKTGGVPR